MTETSDTPTTSYKLSRLTLDDISSLVDPNDVRKVGETTVLVSKGKVLTFSMPNERREFVLNSGIQTPQELLAATDVYFGACNLYLSNITHLDKRRVEGTVYNANVTPPV